MGDGAGSWRRIAGVGVAAAVLIGIGVLIGVLVEGGTEHTPGEPLQASEIGDATKGRELFASQGCVMCHQYEGEGGTDAPPLDFMRGNLAATDIAGMSGVIWNHIPAMQQAFKEEGVPFPTFDEGEMADLISYLHGGGPPPEAGEMHEEGAGHEQGEEEHE